MRSRILKPPQQSFFLLGPRGTGKSTWTRAHFPDAVFVDLLDSALFQRLCAEPGRLQNLIPRAYEDWVVLDEVQRVPELLNEVHRLIETQGLRFVLTGSSARKLRRGGVNLLAGRARTLAMHPFVPEELGEAFDLPKASRFGLLPMATQAKEPAGYLTSYVQTYLQEEVLQEGLTRDLGAFSRFLEAASFSQGTALNVSSVARECGVGRKTAEGYFQILEDLLLMHRLPVFSRRARRRLVQHSKFYFFDAGVFRTLRPEGPLDSAEELGGIALESLVLQTLIACNATLCDPYHLAYWRTHAGREVDFVLYGKHGLWAIEVKASPKVRSGDLKGLQAFATDYPVTRQLLLYGGEREERDGDIDIVPVAAFLRRCRLELQGTAEQTAVA